MPPRRTPAPTTDRNIPTSSNELAELIDGRMISNVLRTGMPSMHNLSGEIMQGMRTLRQAIQFSVSEGEDFGTLTPDFVLRDQHTSGFQRLERAITTATQRERFR